MTPERIVQNEICSYLSRIGVFFFVHDSIGVFDPRRGVFRSNTNRYRRRGVSDLLGIFHGCPLAIEVKSEKGRLSPHQKEFLAAWTLAGGISIVAKSIADVEAGLKSCPHCAKTQAGTYLNHEIKPSQ